MTSDDLLSWLHPFCSDAALPVRPRIDVLQILESNFRLRDSDVRLLLRFRTQAVLKDREVSSPAVVITGGTLIWNNLKNFVFKMAPHSVLCTLAQLSFHQESVAVVRCEKWIVLEFM